MLTSSLYFSVTEDSTRLIASMPSKLFMGNNSPRPRALWFTVKHGPIDTSLTWSLGRQRARRCDNWQLQTLQTFHASFLKAKMNRAGFFACAYPHKNEPSPVDPPHAKHP